MKAFRVHGEIARHSGIKVMFLEQGARMLILDVATRRLSILVRVSPNIIVDISKVSINNKVCRRGHHGPVSPARHYIVTLTIFFSTGIGTFQRIPILNTTHHLLYILPSYYVYVTQPHILPLKLALKLSIYSTPLCRLLLTTKSTHNPPPSLLLT